MNKEDLELARQDALQRRAQREVERRVGSREERDTEEDRLLESKLTEQGWGPVETKADVATNVEEKTEMSVPWPSPLGGAAFHGVSGRFVRLVSPHSESHPAALLASFLTASGSMLGPNVYKLVERSKHPGRLFVTLVGETSKARKGTSWDWIIAVFKEVDPDWRSNIASGMSSGEGLINSVRDPIYKRKKNPDKTSSIPYVEELDKDGVEDKRLLAYESELASPLKLMNKDGNILSPVLRNSWDSGNLRTLTKESPLKATNAHISVVSHVTADELASLLRDVEKSNGFANRFLWFCVKRSKLLPRGGNLKDSDLAPIIGELQQLRRFWNDQGETEIEFDNDAGKLWDEVYEKLSEGSPGILGSMTSRAEAYVIRVALIYALLDKSNEIRIEHLKASLEVWRYCYDSVRFIFQEFTGNKTADELLAKLQTRPGGLSRTEIRDFFGRNQSGRVIDVALALLEDMKLAGREVVSTATKPKEIWKLYDRNDRFD